MRSGRSPAQSCQSLKTEVCQDPDTTGAGCIHQDLDLQKEAVGNKKAIAGELADCPQILVVCMYISSLQRHE